MPNEKDEAVTEREKDAYKAAGSYQREIQSDAMGEAMGTETPPEQSREGSLGKKEGTDTAGTNPKRTENSRSE